MDHRLDFDDYYFPFEDCLRNKLGIHNRVRLDFVSEQIASVNLAIVKYEPVPERFTASYFKHIHKVLFDPVYDWAGEYRICDMSRNQEYCPAKDIGSRMNRFCRKFRLGFLSESFTDGKDMAEGLSAEWAELNRIHAFRDGNGRSQYAFFSKACESKGYALVFSGRDLRSVRAARDLASMGNPDLLYGILRRSIVPMEDALEAGMRGNKSFAGSLRISGSRHEPLEPGPDKDVMSAVDRLFDGNARLDGIKDDKEDGRQSDM